VTAAKIKSKPSVVQKTGGDNRQYIDTKIKALVGKIEENRVLLGKIEDCVKMIAHYSGNNRVLTECGIEHWVLDSKHKRKMS